MSWLSVCELRHPPRVFSLRELPYEQPVLTASNRTNWSGKIDPGQHHLRIPPDRLEGPPHPQRARALNHRNPDRLA